MQLKDKATKINELKQLIDSLNCSIIEENTSKPWGAYFRMSDENCKDFISHYFAEYQSELEHSNLPISPKFLLIAPHARLSWQYHHRRSELWYLVEGPAMAITSGNDIQTKPVPLQTSKVFKVDQGIRHRLLSGDDWSIIAEIWIHTQADNPSTEEDNIRLDDDYQRTGNSDRGESVFL